MADEHDLPDSVRRKAVGLGSEGEAWVAALSPLLADVSARWGLTVGEPLGGGTDAFVAEATTRDGREAVLKLIPPSRQRAGEVDTLVSAAGRGYAEVYAADRRRGAVLLERLGPPLADLNLPVGAQLDVLYEVLLEAWSVSLDGASLTTGADKAAALSESIRESWRALGFPDPDPVLDTALRFAAERRRRYDPRTAVVAHGDPHPWNTLVVPGTQPRRFKLIDPDGLFVERAYDLGVLMREWSGAYGTGNPLDAAVARCRRLADRAGVSPDAVWQWGFVECVSTGLLCRRLGLEDGGELLDIARAWTEGSDGPLPG